MFIQIHAIHSVPPSCINRDDVGAAKIAVYGGARRHRVSSQAWKRAMRTYAANAGLSESATRTRRLTNMIADKVVGDFERKDVIAKANEVVNSAGFKTKKDKNKDEDGNLLYLTDALAFVSPGEADVLTRITTQMLSGETEISNAQIKNELESVKVTPDVALFGRMVASDKGLNVDACAQVAHAISTHEAHPEVDFYTAVDDVTTDSEGGSGFLGAQEFVSSTLLRYASVDVDRLCGTLGDDTARNVLPVFIESFVKSMPTGKSNSFANTTLPDYVLVEVVDAPVNYVGAFENPVRSRGDLVGASIAALSEYRNTISRVYGLNNAFLETNTHDPESSTLPELCEWTKKQV